MLHPLQAQPTFVTLVLSGIVEYFFNTTYIRCTTQISGFTSGGGRGAYVASAIPTFATAANQPFNASAKGKWDKCLGIVIHHCQDPAGTLGKFERFLRMDAENSFHRRRYLIHFTRLQSVQFAEFFQSPHLKFIQELLILKEHATQELVEFYTVSMIGTRIKLATLKPSEINTLKSLDLFPNKMRDMQKREFKVGMGPFIPLSHPETLKGVESHKLMTFAHKYNLSLVIDKSEKSIGEIFPNWTGTGFMGKIMADQLDLISFGIYLQNWRTKYGDHSYPTSTLLMTCLVPQPRLLALWQIVEVFKYDVWILMILMCAISAKIFEIQKTVQNSPYEVVLKIMFGQGNNSRTLKRKRLLAGVLLTCVIIIHTFFGSKLASFLILPEYTDNIKTLQDLADSKLLWYSKVLEKANALKFAEKDPQKTLYQKFRPATDQLLREMLKKNQKFAFAIDLSIKSGFYNVDEFFNLQILQKFKLMREALIERQYTVFFLRKHSFYTLPMQRWQRSIYESGFAMYWEKFSITTGREFYEQAHLNKKDDSIDIRKLHMAQLYGTFILLALGLSLSTLVFIAELLRPLS